MRVAEFDYALPPELIAQRPAAERTASRLLHLDAASGPLSGSGVRRPARPRRCARRGRDERHARDQGAARGRKASGGRVELFVERVAGPREALALIRSSHPPPGHVLLRVGDGARGTVLRAARPTCIRVRFAEDVARTARALRRGPLPPYIAHAPDATDAERYQTVYAERPGAVAAPTAGLHFDRAMLARLEARGARLARVTLHVGAGTFLPVRVEQVEAHRMHKERYTVPRETLDAIAGRRVLAVGTTTLRALEGAALSGADAGETDLFIYPGFRFRVVQRLLTNFHLPRSSLLMLVAAFAGLENVRRAYAHAIERRYRFFSYGDAMLIERAA
jgi:S-adenosylmethionine:tRNA ribosyltransferase-isomerase